MAPSYNTRARTKQIAILANNGNEDQTKTSKSINKTAKTSASNKRKIRANAKESTNSNSELECNQPPPEKVHKRDAVAKKDEWVEPNYQDKEWFDREATRCQVCRNIYPHPAAVSICVTRHKKLRCYICFGVYSDSSDLFAHYGRRHGDSDNDVAEDDATKLKANCPYCNLKFGFTSVSAHVISTHLVPNSEEQCPISTKSQLKTKSQPPPPPPRLPSKEPEEENDDAWMEPDYSNHFWIYREIRRCQVCDRTLETPSKASDCVTGHGKLRCYLCFWFCSDTERLFDHFAKRHNGSVSGKNASISKVICPYCKEDIPFKSVSCHMISKHLSQSDSECEKYVIF